MVVKQNALFLAFCAVFYVLQEYVASGRQGICIQHTELGALQSCSRYPEGCNGGICLQDWSCRCPTRKTGWDCSLDLASELPVSDCPDSCSFRGSCYNVTGVPSCKCQPEYMNANCDRYRVYLECRPQSMFVIVSPQRSQNEFKGKISVVDLGTNIGTLIPIGKCILGNSRPLWQANTSRIEVFMSTESNASNPCREKLDLRCVSPFQVQSCYSVLVQYNELYVSFLDERFSLCCTKAHSKSGEVETISGYVTGDSAEILRYPRYINYTSCFTENELSSTQTTPDKTVSIVTEEDVSSRPPPHQTTPAFGLSENEMPSTQTTPDKAASTVTGEDVSSSLPPPQTTPRTEKTDLGVIVGSIVGCVIGVLVVIVAVCLILRRRSSKQGKADRCNAVSNTMENLSVHTSPNGTLPQNPVEDSNSRLPEIRRARDSGEEHTYIYVSPDGIVDGGNTQNLYEMVNSSELTESNNYERLFVNK